MSSVLPGLDRVLFLSSVNDREAAGGRAMLGRIVSICLKDLLGDRLIQVGPDRPASRSIDAWRGYVDGVDRGFLSRLLAKIGRERVNHLFVDGSNYGAAIAHVKRHAPHVRITTLFHNIEARFFWGAVRERRSPKSVAVLAANYLAERQAVRRSDSIVTLSERDSAGLRRLYGRGADAILPMVLEDRAPPPPAAPPPAGSPYLLFVGGGFYANIAGIRWFADTVAPRVAIPVKVVGRGMEELDAAFVRSPTMELVGAVDALAPWYAGASLVIAPIFDGSGMKTKVAEALMHGKRIAGTPEAFSGYAEDVVAANHCCPDADAFVAAIEQALVAPPPAHDPALRALYERDHSPRAARARLARIMGVPDAAAGSAGRVSAG